LFKKSSSFLPNEAKSGKSISLRVLLSTANDSQRKVHKLVANLWPFVWITPRFNFARQILINKLLSASDGLNIHVAGNGVCEHTESLVIVVIKREGFLPVIANIT